MNGSELTRVAAKPFTMVRRPNEELSCSENVLVIDGLKWKHETAQIINVHHECGDTELSSFSLSIPFFECA